MPSCKSQVVAHAFDYKPGLLWSSSMCSINLLEWLTRPRETLDFHSPKNTDEQPDGRDVKRHEKGVKGCGHFRPSLGCHPPVPLCVQLPGSSLSFWVFRELHRHDQSHQPITMATGDHLNFSFLSRGGGRAPNVQLSILPHSFWIQPHPEFI